MQTFESFHHSNSFCLINGTLAFKSLCERSNKLAFIISQTSSYAVEILFYITGSVDITLQHPCRRFAMDELFLF
jgi:hypothetical protein